MIGRISREEIRSEPLFYFCKRAKTTIHEFGEDDNREFCYGSYTNYGIGFIKEECLHCKAFLRNAKQSDKGAEE